MIKVIEYDMNYVSCHCDISSSAGNNDMMGLNMDTWGYNYLLE